MDLATLGLRIDSTQVRSAVSELGKLDSAGRRAERSAQRVERSMRSVGGAVRFLKGALAALAIGATTKRIIELGDAYAGMAARLSLVTKNAEQFERVQQALFDMANRTRTGLVETTDLYAKLARSTETLGVSENELLKVTEAINQSFIVSGTSAAQAAGSLVQLGQAFASGTLRGDELNSVLEGADRLAKAIADGLGVTRGELRKLGSEGKLTSEAVFKALIASAASVEAEFRRMPLTVAQSVTQARNAMLEFVGAFDQASGASRALAELISSVADVLRDLAAEARQTKSDGAISQWAEDATVSIAELIENLVLAARTAAVVVNAFRSAYADIRVAGNISKNMFGGAFFKENRDALADALADRNKTVADFNKQLDDLIAGDHGKLSRRLRERFDALRATGSKLAGPVKVDPVKGALGAGKASDAELQAMRKAQLRADLDAIKRHLDGMTSAYKGAEQILEATRDAALISEKQFYEAKRAFIRLNEQEEVRALEAENERLKKEKVSGAARIDLQRQIAENEAKIASIRSESVVQLELLSIAENDSLRRMKVGFDEAEASAQAFLDTLRRGQESQLTGMGLGESERRRREGRAQIDERYAEQRLQLESERRRDQITAEQYSNELDRINRFQASALQSYDGYYDRLLRRQQDWQVGASEALNNYLDESRNVAKQTEEAFSGAFDALEEGLFGALQGEFDSARDFFRAIERDWIAAVNRMIAKAVAAQLVERLMGTDGASGPVARFISGLFGGSGGGPGTAAYSSQMNNLTYLSKGGVISAPTLFRTAAGGMGMMGEAGYEGVLPLARGPDGKLGVRSHGGSVTNNTVQMTIVTQDAESFRRSEGQITSRLAGGLSRSRRFV